MGDLAGGRYYDKDSIAAVTLGMSTNAAYMEQAQAVPRWNGSSAKSGEIVSCSITNMCFYFKTILEF